MADPSGGKDSGRMTTRTHTNPKQQKGFSLLEIVTLVAVVLLLSGLAFPRITRYWQAYQLDSATQVLSSNLEVARYSAISKGYNIIVKFNAAAGSYEIFEDKNENGIKDSGEITLGSYSLPNQVGFNGSGLQGPPSNPSGAVGDPITFSNDKAVFNDSGKLNSGTGTIYMQNAVGDASAISFNFAGRMKVFRWVKSTNTWK